MVTTMREGWEVATLGSLVSLEYGKALPAKNRIKGDVPVFGSNGIVGSHNEKLISGPGIVVGRKGTAGSVTWSSGDFFPIDTTYWVRLKSEELGMRFAYLTLSNLNLPRLNAQTGVPGLNRDNAYRQEILLAPLHEQKRIVDLMDSIDTAISAAQAEVAAAGELRGDLFDGLLRQFVDECELRSLGELGEFIRGRRFTKDDYVDEGLGCLHYGQVHTHFGLTAYEPLTFVPSEMKERLRFASTGDVVIAATSEDLGDLGKATVWLGAEDVAVHDDCQIFRHKLDPLFATHLIASHGFHRQKVQYAAGTKVTRISGPNLAKMEFRVPPRSRQEEIGRTMASLDFATEKAQNSLDHLRILRSSMLSVLLSGEHEIPDSYDQFLDLRERAQAG